MPAAERERRWPAEAAPPGLARETRGLLCDSSSPRRAGEAGGGVRALMPEEARVASEREAQHPSHLLLQSMARFFGDFPFFLWKRKGGEGDARRREEARGRERGGQRGSIWTGLGGVGAGPPAMTP